MHGGVTGKASDGLPMSIFKPQAERWDDRPFSPKPGRAQRIRLIRVGRLSGTSDDSPLCAETRLSFMREAILSRRFGSDDYQSSPHTEFTRGRKDC